jgi:hypothetical protein
MANDVTVPTKNAYELYAEQFAGGPSFVGDLLKFDKFGKWRAGQDAREVPIGTKLIFGVQTLKIGWTKWADGRPSVVKMVNVEDINNGSASAPATRDQLGDDDHEMWEQDNRGDPVDPWVFSNSIVLYDPEDGQLYTFSARSKGGMNAIGEVIKQFIPHSKTAPSEVPTVELASDSYEHREYGTIMIPKFKVLQNEWVEMPDEIVHAQPNEAVDEDEAPRRIEAPQAHRSAPRPAARLTPTPAKPSKPSHKPAPKSGGRGTGAAKMTVIPGKGKRNGPQKGVRF